MSNLVKTILGKLDKAALIYSPADGFQLENPPPAWFTEIWGEAKNVESLGKSDYLDNFIIDAKEHWATGSEDSLSSGPFIESVSFQNELPLEAQAIVVDGSCILIISNLGESYLENLDTLQAARQNLLTQEQLEIEVSKRTTTIREREAELSGRLIYASGFRDEETGAHIRRIGLYSAEMARVLEWPQLAIDDIRAAAPMHDIGKIGIPDSILKKPGRLTEEEFEVMKKHPTIGSIILGDSNIEMIQMAAEIAEGHHENWDGSGYPAGLKGDQIPIAARIVAIVDVYDALVHARVYKAAHSELDAIALMKELVGTKFDPELFQIFLDNLPAMRAIREKVQD